MYGNVKIPIRLRHLIFRGTDFNMLQQSFSDLKTAKFVFSQKGFNETIYLVYVKDDDNYLIVTRQRLKILKVFWKLDMEILEVCHPKLRIENK